MFGDFHFNPKHALAEQLVWDAGHAPENVGFSHNVQARTVRQGDETLVEAILKVHSVDLVADPATTCGLFEQEQGRASGTLPTIAQPWTLEQLRVGRPDLVRQIEEAACAELSGLRLQLDGLLAEQALRESEDRLRLAVEAADIGRSQHVVDQDRQPGPLWQQSERDLDIAHRADMCAPAAEPPRDK